MAKKKDQTLLYIGAGLAAVYLLTRQQQQQTTQIPVQPAPGRGGGATWVDVALEYGDDLFNVLFGKRNRQSSGNLTGDVTFIPNSGGFPIPIQIQGIEQQSEGEITDVQWN